jgi:hypothetical protein
MSNPRDARIPGASTAWQLWHSDTFDRDSSPSLQASGEDIRRGLYELWLYTLREGIQDNGSASFSYFYLTWGNTATSRVDVYVEPFGNAPLMKLRRWARLTEQDREAASSVAGRLAQLHYELLQKSDRWTAAAIDWSAEAKELLRQVGAMTDAAQLDRFSEE